MAQVTMYPGQKDSPSTFTTGNISSVDTLLLVANASILPQTFPYPLTLGIDKASTEVVLVTAGNNTTNQLTIQRTNGIAWSSGAKCARVFNAADLTSLQANINDLETNKRNVGDIPLVDIVDVATTTILYRKTAGTGPLEAQTLATLKSDLGLSGTNSGDNGVAHTGEVTGNTVLTIGTNAVTTAKIADKNVTFAKLPDMTAPSVLYRKTAGTGPVEAQTLGTLKSDLGLSGNNTGDNPGVISVSGTSPIVSSGGTTPIISIPAATNATPGHATASQIAAIEANSAKVSNATHTGEVTGSTALTITNKAVTLAKMADIPTGNVIYRKTAGTGAPEVQSLNSLKKDLELPFHATDVLLHVPFSYAGANRANTNGDGGEASTESGAVIGVPGEPFGNGALQTITQTRNLCSFPTGDTWDGWYTSWGDLVAFGVSADHYLGKSMRLTSRDPGGVGAQLILNGLLTPNTIYTFSVDVKATSDIEGDVNIRVWGDSWAVLGFSSNHPKDGKWHRLSVQFNSGTHTSISAAVTPWTMSVGKYIDFNAASITATPYIVPFIYGEMPGCYWEGTRYFSNSIATASVINYPTKDNISAGVGTISMWVNATAHNPIYGFLFAAGNTNAEFDLALYSGIFIGKVNGVGVNGAFPTGSWVHLVVTWETGGDYRVYLNGVLAGTTPYSPITLGTQLSVGGTTCLDPNYNHLGHISDFFTASRAYTADEISAIYQSGSPVVVSQGTHELYSASETGYSKINQSGIVTTVRPSTLGHVATVAGALTSSRIPFIDANGRLTDSNKFIWATDRLDITGDIKFSGKLICAQSGNYFYAGYHDAVWSAYLGLNVYHNGLNWVQATEGFSGAGVNLRIGAEGFEFLSNPTGGGVGNTVTPVKILGIYKPGGPSHALEVTGDIYASTSLRLPNVILYNTEGPNEGGTICLGSYSGINHFIENANGSLRGKQNAWGAQTFIIDQNGNFTASGSIVANTTINAIGGYQINGATIITTGGSIIATGPVGMRGTTSATLESGTNREVARITGSMGNNSAPQLYYGCSYLVTINAIYPTSGDSAIITAIVGRSNQTEVVNVINTAASGVNISLVLTATYDITLGTMKFYVTQTNAISYATKIHISVLCLTNYGSKETLTMSL